jgi:hypothetical protein
VADEEPLGGVLVFCAIANGAMRQKDVANKKIRNINRTPMIGEPASWGSRVLKVEDACRP